MTRALKPPSVFQAFVAGLRWQGPYRSGPRRSDIEFCRVKSVRPLSAFADDCDNLVVRTFGACKNVASAEMRKVLLKERGIPTALLCALCFFTGRSVPTFLSSRPEASTNVS